MSSRPASLGLAVVADSLEVDILLGAASGRGRGVPVALLRSVGRLQPDRLPLLDLHDLLHYAVLHQVIDLGIVDGLPVLHELLQRLLQLQLQVVDVGDLVVGGRAEGLQNRQLRIEVPRILIVQLSVVVLHDHLEVLHVSVDSGSAVAPSVASRSSRRLPTL